MILLANPGLDANNAGAAAAGRKPRMLLKIIRDEDPIRHLQILAARALRRVVASGSSPLRGEARDRGPRDS